MSGYRSGIGSVLSTTTEQYSDGSAYLEWFNTKDGAADPDANWYPAFKDADADLGEVYKMVGDQGKRLWDLIPRRDMVRTFLWPKMLTGKRPQKIPAEIRKFFGGGAKVG
jgi:hypothetical protein